MARIAKADQLVENARWLSPDANNSHHDNFSRYATYLSLASQMYADAGLRLLSRRVSAIAEASNPRQAWQRFDRLNARQQIQ
jgi:hypothetical protein